MTCLLVGCGPAVSDPADSGTGGANGSSTAAVSTTTSAGASGAETSSARSSGASSSGLGTSGSSGSTGNPDVPLPPACLQPGPGIVVVERAEGPDGPLELATAGLRSDWCSQGAAIDVRDGSGNSVFQCFMPDEPLDGVVACDTFERVFPIFDVEMFEPFVDPDPGVPTDGLFLRARVVGIGEGWDVAFEVDLPDCGEPTCSCPCD